MSASQLAEASVLIFALLAIGGLVVLAVMVVGAWHVWRKRERDS